ncbi:MAG: hypothetical protein J5525_04150 [Lachnospiraceae bacterium]|nr:hypothetical protein [Lachnospiraceae bacterium]
MVKHLNFKLESDKLINMSDSELLMEIAMYTRRYIKEYTSRLKLFKECMSYNSTFYSRTNIEKTRISGTGVHSDITQDNAIRQMDCETICSENATLEDVKRIDQSAYPDDIKLLIALKRGILLYEKVLILFPDDMREVVQLRMKGYTVEQIAEELGRGETYVNERFSRVKKEISKKAKELATYLEFTR